MSIQTAAYHNHSEYMQAYNAWLNAPAVIKPNGETFIKGKNGYISKAAFDAANPKPHYDPLGGNDCNGDRNATLYGVRNTKK